MRDNRLIAEFMGGIPSSVPNLIHLPQTIGESSIFCVKGSEGLPSGTFKIKRINELEYYTSWKWLMPVVDKIESLKDTNGNAYRFTIDMCNAQIEGTPIEVSGGSYKRDATYKAVVEFIKWYNNKSK